MRTLLLALVVVFSVSLIALASMPAISAQPAKAAAKSSIYGTPAQLVEDLRSAGIDLTRGLFTKPELLEQSSLEKKSGQLMYKFDRGTVRYSEKPGKLVGFSLLAAQKPKLPVLPWGELSKLIGLDTEDLLARYGSEYASEMSSTEDRVRFKYYILVPSAKYTIWTIMLITAKQEKFSGIIGMREDTDVPLASYDDIIGGKAELRGASLIYQDFWKLGLGLGAQSSRPDIMSRGVSPSESLAGPEKILQFGTSIVGFDPTDNNVLSFFIGYQNPYRNRFAPIVLDEPILDSLNFPTGSVKWLIMKGPKAVVERYGPSQGEKGKPMNLAYGLLLEINGVVGICDFRFDYELDGDDSMISAYGSFMPYNMYRVQVAASQS